MNDPNLELAQLLCTRLCHDLAGPVGAVAAGVELIGGDPSQVDAETLGLIGNSSAAASLKLKFMRGALGAVGASGDPKGLLEGYLDAVAGPSGKPTVAWPSPEVMTAGALALGAGWVRIVLNLCLLALETQPACKSLMFAVNKTGGFTITIESRGAPDRAAMLKDELIAAVAGAATPALTAKTVHGNVAGRVVRAAGGTVTLTASGNCVTVAAIFPASANGAA